MSFARALYEQCGLPQLWSAFSDDRVLITYEMNGVTKQCRGILRDVRLDLVQSDDGILEKRVIGQLVVSRDEYSVMGGIDDPQLKATFTINDGQGRQSTWSVMSNEGVAIEAKTGSLVVINIVKTRAAAISRREYRR